MRKHARALRGATTVERDDPALIDAATRELLAALLAANALAPTDIVSALFTLTQDLRSAFPATTARDLGWHDVPMLCTVEIPVPGSLPRCLRVLLHVETGRARSEMRHIYLRDARALRPDLTSD
jgi:chorismate mutase